MPDDPALPGPDGSITFAPSATLNEPEKLLAAYFSSSTVGFSVVDADTRFLAINDTLASINGKPASEHLGKTAREVLGDFVDVLEPKFQRVLSTGESVTFEISGNLPTRTEPGHWIVHYLPIKDATGTVTRVGSVIVEINTKKKLEESLHDIGKKLNAEMSRLQMLMEVSTLLSSNWDLQKIFPQISARIRRVLRQEYASLALQDASSGLLVRQALDFPLGRGLIIGDPMSASDSPPGHAFLARKAMIFSKEQLTGFDTELTRGILAEGLLSLCCVPLLRPNGPLGVVVLGSTRRNAFHSEDLTVLNQVAAQLAFALENHRAAAEIEALKERLSEERKHLDGDVRLGSQFAEIVGESTALKQVLDQVATVAASDATVLILGETGTGKELIARAIHQLSRRKESRFVKVNCAAIPTGLLESELFGHEKGAFTGAVSQKIGRMEVADGGTLLLDEIGEIPLELQPKLLRVLQDQEFERLGSNRTIKVNLRVIAATNRDLAKGIANGQFRTDLFYRLNVFPIRVPPLRERREDIPLLVRYFVRKFALRMNRHIETVPNETMKALSEWSWPGNIRELENLMERSVILSERTALRVPLDDLRFFYPSNQPDHTLDNAEREHIIRILRESGGVLSGPNGAAHRLGLKRTTLQSRMQRLKITRRDYSGPR
jgi:formate hydrogenlyase transcriptional activator